MIFHTILYLKGEKIADTESGTLSVDNFSILASMIIQSLRFHGLRMDNFLLLDPSTH